MYGVYFDEEHYGCTLDCIMNYARVGLPEPKTKQIEIPGMDGVLDLTESTGAVRYATREISLRFTATNKAKLDKLMNDIHGRQKKIILDREPDYVYTGRCTVDSILISGPFFVMDAHVTCDPYKLMKRKTLYVKQITGSETIILTNDAMWTTPEITVDAPMYVTFENKKYKLDVGNYYIEDIVMRQKYNRFVVEGRGKITFRYQEGRL